ncbi:hypothetical protein EDC65_1681 [Stella humosa]|uniref:histidine kinase n=1 Tax=Stella humosa TaxID=94 RepID=A0A3N1M884_9PROT|nr:PAS domain-containing sensor histidine kinase [Stella humosa]ROP99890.1 hypothetical protein EDC65_1681 [Stella humosa]BBK30880.1 histidine kinase [Stella humosa]
MAATDDSRFRILIEAVVDYAIYSLDLGGRVASWNAGARRFKGYEEAEILGHHFSRFYVEEDRQAGLPARALETAAREGRFENEGWRVRKDGTRFWAHVVIDPIRAEDGALTGFAKITRDMTERWAVREQLRRSEEQFQLLVRGVSDYAIYMLDLAGHVTSWNLGAERINGYMPDEIIGQHFGRFYTAQDQAAGEPRLALETALRQGRYEREGWRVRKDGTRFMANVVIEPIRTEDGLLLGFAKVTRDITTRVEAQRTLAEAQEALFQAQKMEALGRLTGGVAHDFNNLLMVVLGSLDLLKRRLDGDARTGTLIENAIEAARRGAVLTQRMLAFSRRQELALEPVDLPTLMRDMAELVRRSIGPAVTVDFHVPPQLPAILADTNQLELAILNLAVNARDAMPEGGTIAIAAREEAVSRAMHGLEPGRYICISVADHGQGMDETTLRRATEPFFTTKGIGKGTGLGLPMVHGVAEQLGGTLHLSSRAGVGTVAEIWLPVAHGVKVPVVAAAAPVRPQAVARALHVLVVDDDRLVLANIVAMLEDLGHRTTSAASGAEAIAHLRAGTPFDLVLTDQAMPQMTGQQLAQAIAAARPDLPIVLASGFAELPADAIHLPRLAKPFTQAQLAAALAESMKAGMAVR